MSTIGNPQPSLGDRFNEGKLRWSLLPYEALAEIVKVLMFGANKYGSHNWQKGLKYSETFESLQRHVIAWHNGEDKDPETGLSHLAHVGCNVLFLLWFSITGKGVDDRANFNVKSELPEWDGTIGPRKVCIIPGARYLYSGQIISVPDGTSPENAGVQMRD